MVSGWKGVYIMTEQKEKPTDDLQQNKEIAEVLEAAAIYSTLIKQTFSDVDQHLQRESLSLKKKANIQKEGK